MRTPKVHSQIASIWSVLLFVNLLGVARSFIPSPLAPRRHSLTNTFMGRRTFGAPKIVEDANIDFTNFWRRSIANFTLCEKPEGDPDFESYGGSIYWDQGDHVCRYSDHWTGQHGVTFIKECKWYLEDFEQPIPNMCVAAKCNYDDFLMIKKKTMKKRNKWKKRKG